MEEPSLDDITIPAEATVVGSKWAIGTYLRLKPPTADETDLVHYKIQSKILLTLLSRFDRL